MIQTRPEQVEDETPCAERNCRVATVILVG